MIQYEVDSESMNHCRSSSSSIWLGFISNLRIVNLLNLLVQCNVFWTVVYGESAVVRFNGICNEFVRFFLLVQQWKIGRFCLPQYENLSYKSSKVGNLKFNVELAIELDRMYVPVFAIDKIRIHFHNGIKKKTLHFKNDLKIAIWWITPTKKNVLLHLKKKAYLNLQLHNKSYPIVPH